MVTNRATAAARVPENSTQSPTFELGLDTIVFPTRQVELSGKNIVLPSTSRLESSPSKGESWLGSSVQNVCLAPMEKVSVRVLTTSGDLPNSSEQELERVKKSVDFGVSELSSGLKDSWSMQATFQNQWSVAGGLCHAVSRAASVREVDSFRFLSCEKRLCHTPWEGSPLSGREQGSLARRHQSDLLRSGHGLHLVLERGALSATIRSHGVSFETSRRSGPDGDWRTANAI